MAHNSTTPTCCLLVKSVLGKLPTCPLPRAMDDWYFLRSFLCCIILSEAQLPSRLAKQCSPTYTTLGSAAGTQVVEHISLRLFVLRGNKLPDSPTQLQSPLGYLALRAWGRTRLKGRAQIKVNLVSGKSQTLGANHISGFQIFSYV